jgi:hypothetical protein
MYHVWYTTMTVVGAIPGKSSLHAHLGIIILLCAKFHLNPLRNVGGVAVSDIQTHRHTQKWVTKQETSVNEVNETESHHRTKLYLRKHNIL